MKTYEEQKALVKELIRRNPDLDEVECKEIIAEDEHRLLVRVVGAIKMSGRWWPTLNHELWCNKEKYKRGIPAETVRRRRNVYMTNIVGSSEETLIEYFCRLPACSH